MSGARGSDAGSARRRVVFSPAVAILLGALSLSAAASVQAQDAPFWSARLSVFAVPGGFGCEPARMGELFSCSALLTDDDFTLGGTEFSILRIRDFGEEHDRLEVTFDQAIESPPQDLKFCLGTDAYDFPDASFREYGWDADAGWSAGTTVFVSIGNSCQAPSTDATLSGLTASSSTSSGGTYTALTLTPTTFSATTTNYTATVASERTHAKLTPTATHASATVEVRKGMSGSFTTVPRGSASAPIGLDVGANAITLRVTAQDGTTKDYTVTITRQAPQSSNANLSSLAASSSTSAEGTYAALTLTPATFSPATTGYAATVANARTHAKLTPTVEDSGKATVTVAGMTVDSGSASGPISLNQGVNPITVRVTAEDGTTKDYTVTITRDASQATPTVSLSASPNPVDEGSPVTVTATLSAVATSTMDIPLRLTDDTAEPEDHGMLTSITISSGSTSGTGTIATNQDTGRDDEAFTVALGALPPEVAAGTPSSVQVSIRDDDRPPTGPTPPTGGTPEDGGESANGSPSVRASCAPCETGPGGEVRLTARASDPDGDRLTYRWSAPEGSFPEGSGRASARWRAPFRLGRVRIRVRVSDGAGGSATDTVTVEVVNEVPAFGASSYAFGLRENEDGSRQAVALGAVTAEDPDGDALTYDLVFGDRERFAVGASDGAVRYVGPGEDYESGPKRHSLTVRARDPHGAEALARVVVEVTNVNEAPAAVGTIPDRTLPENGAPEAVEVGRYFADEDGDALTYRAWSSDPRILAVEVVGPVLTLTPREYGSAIVTVTAEDPEGLTAEQTFGVGIDDELARWTVRQTLAGMARGHMASARLMLGRRASAAGPAGGSRLTVLGRSVPLDGAAVRAATQLLAGWAARAAEHGEGSDRLGVGSAVGPRGAGMGSGWPGGGNRFAGLGGVFGGFRGGMDPLRGSEFQLAVGGAPGDSGVPGRAWQVWGRGDIQTFAGAPAGVTDYEGDVRTGYVGVDRVLSERLMAGVAVSRSLGGGDWRAAGTRGALSTRLTAAYPYVRWTDGPTSAWAAIGGGRGSAENERQTGRTGASDVDLRLGLVEGRRQVAALGGVRLAARADAAWAQLRTGAGEETVDGQSVTVHQVRAGAEASRALRWDSGLSLVPFGELHVRRDGGAGAAGTGVELVAGTRLSAGRVRLDAQGRLLALHSASGYRERGVGVTLGVGSGGRTGLSLSVSPRWGDAATDGGTLWEEQAYRRSLRKAVADRWALDARGEYGVRLRGGGLLTWFGSLSRSAYGRRFVVGGRFGADDGMLPPGW